jgi:uncharacterized protein (TIGR02145 family)
MKYPIKECVLIVFIALCISCKKDKNQIDCTKFKIEKAELNCNQYEFISSTNEYLPYWNVYKSQLDTHLCYGKKEVFNFNPTEPGEYIIEAVYESVSCPNGFKISSEVSVDETCFQDTIASCEDIEVQVTKKSCFEYSLQSNIANSFWIVNGENQGISSSVLNLSLSEAKNYKIISGYVNDACPDSVFRELVIEVDSDCLKDLVFDCEGNSYKTVTIGTQTWMAENLRTTKYNNCSPIELAEDSASWVEKGNNSLGLYCYYDNDMEKYAKFTGALYNWHAVNTEKLCPVGWHVPSIDEWQTFENYLFTQGLSDHFELATSLRSAVNWSPTTSDLSGNGTDLFGWNGTGTGHRNVRNHFFNIDGIAYYWSSSMRNSWPWYQGLFSTFIKNDYKQTHGMGVRCLKD